MPEPLAGITDATAGSSYARDLVFDLGQATPDALADSQGELDHPIAEERPALTWHDSVMVEVQLDMDDVVNERLRRQLLETFDNLDEWTGGVAWPLGAK